MLLLALYTREWIFDRFLLSDYLSRVTNILAIIGILTTAYAAFSMRSSLTVFPSPKQNGDLITTGLFAFSRHPVYTGLVLFTFSYALSKGSYWKLIVSLGLLLLFYVKSQYEERLLIRKFPDYSAYRKKTGRFFPFFRRNKASKSV